MRFMARRSEERGNTENVWLKTFHTFSFATYVSSITLPAHPGIAHHRTGIRMVNTNNSAPCVS